MFDLLREISTRHFDGDIRKGERRDFIFSLLKKNKCKPVFDQYGNIWVEKGSGNKTILFSSHIDVDPRIDDLSFKEYKVKRKKYVSGVLDNSVGCLLNYLLAIRQASSVRKLFVFTASEEIEYENPRRFCRSAREVVRELKDKSLTPDLSIVLDVTFPALLLSQEKLNWSAKYSKSFDINDSTHCYIDGYIHRDSAKIAKFLLERFKNNKISMRKLTGQDESLVYGRISPSFAFGPVVFGGFDEPNQYMPLSHLNTSFKFLKQLVSYYESF